MNVCTQCSTVGETGRRNHLGLWLCKTCYYTNEHFLFNHYSFDLETQTLTTSHEWRDKEESWQRSRTIQLYERVFSNFSGREAKQIKDLIEKGYSYLDIAMAVEFIGFFTSRFKKISSSVPYAISDAKKHYNTVNYRNKEKFLRNAKEALKKPEVVAIAKSEKKNRKEKGMLDIDLLKGE